MRPYHWVHIHVMDKKTYSLGINSKTASVQEKNFIKYIYVTKAIKEVNKHEQTEII